MPFTSLMMGHLLLALLSPCCDVETAPKWHLTEAAQYDRALGGAACTSTLWKLKPGHLHPTLSESFPAFKADCNKCFGTLTPSP